MFKTRLLLPLSLIVVAGAVGATDAPAQKKAHRPAKTSMASVASHEQGRDWSRIDTNKDSLISPEEMEKFLADNPGSLKK